MAGGGTTWYVGGVRAPTLDGVRQPRPGALPHRRIAQAAARILSDPARAAVALQYGSVQGQPEMLSLVADKLYREEGISVAQENIVITNGASAAIGLAARSLIDEGDVVLVEAPSFPGALSVFQQGRGRAGQHADGAARDRR